MKQQSKLLEYHQSEGQILRDTY